MKKLMSYGSSKGTVVTGDVYPCLMQGNSGAVYLMVSKSRGTCVLGGGDVEVGETSTSLLPSCLYSYEGTITLGMEES
jgi:hypothetical protein